MSYLLKDINKLKYRHTSLTEDGHPSEFRQELIDCIDSLYAEREETAEYLLNNPIRLADEGSIDIAYCKEMEKDE